MQNHVFVIMTTAAIFACGAIDAGAQAPVAPSTDHEMGYGMPMTRPIPGVTQPIRGAPTMQHQDTQMNDDDVLPFDDEDDQNETYVIVPGMMGSHGVLPLESENDQNGVYLIQPRMMSAETMERGWHHGWHRGRAMMPPVMA